MEQLIDFLVENYIWIIIIGIVILMTIIGYIADKTDFGKESMTTKKEKKKVEKSDEIKEPMIIPAFETDEMENLDKMEIPPSNEEIEQAIIPETYEQPIEKIEQPIESLEEETLDKRTIRKMKKEESRRLKEEAKRLKEEKKRKKVELVEETPSVEESKFEEQPEEVVIAQPSEEISLDLFEPMEEPSLEVENPAEFELDSPEQQIELESEHSFSNNIDEIPEIDLPSIESLDQELSQDTEEDDIWKF